MRGVESKKKDSMTARVEEWLGTEYCSVAVRWQQDCQGTSKRSSAMCLCDFSLPDQRQEGTAVCGNQSVCREKAAESWPKASLCDEPPERQRDCRQICCLCSLNISRRTQARESSLVAFHIDNILVSQHDQCRVHCTAVSILLTRKFRRFDKVQSII